MAKLKNCIEFLIFINLLKIISVIDFSSASSLSRSDSLSEVIDLLSEPENFNSNKVVFNQSNYDEFDENSNYGIPVRFDGDQLFRITNLKRSDHEKTLAYLENNYNINIWNGNNLNAIDFSVPKSSLDNVKNYLKNHNLTYEILLDDIQEAIDNETRTEGRYRRSIRVIEESTAQPDDDGTGFMSWNEYHGLKDIYGMLRHYNRTKPRLCKLYNIGKSNENRPLLVLKISGSNRNNQSVWIDGGIHAREWISPAAVTYIIYHFVENWSNLPAYIRNIDWYLMPMVNPDGYEYSRKFNRLWRKNRKPNSLCDGVDLNRNFGFQWDADGSSSTNPCAETYRGSDPFSEPESRAIANFMNRIKSTLTSYLTIHSYGQYILYPWAYIKSIPKDYRRMRDVGNELAKSANEIAGKVYKVAPAHILGVAGGGSDDWAKATYDLDYVYTIELRDTGEYGFVLPIEQIYETCREALRMVKTLSKFISNGRKRS